MEQERDQCEQRRALAIYRMVFGQSLAGGGFDYLSAVPEFPKTNGLESWQGCKLI
jgi:hypothetical protein